jgi:uncharacterized protein
VKLFNRQLIVYSEKFYESRPPVYTIKYGSSQIISYSFTSKLNDLVGEASLEYTDPPTGKLISATFTPSPAPIGVTAKLKLNLGVQGAEGGGGGGAPAAREGGGPISFLSADADVAQAKAKVEAHARAKNKKEFSCTMQLFGSPDYLSGLNVELVDWGIFDGTWFIEVATHTINASGYVTELQMRKVLGW